MSEEQVTAETTPGDDATAEESKTSQSHSATTPHSDTKADLNKSDDHESAISDESSPVEKQNAKMASGEASEEEISVETDIFVHQSVIQGEGWRSLKPGEQIKFTIRLSKLAISTILHLK